MTLRISELPVVTKVGVDDYLIINEDNKVTSSISAYNLSLFVGQMIYDFDLLPPDLNIDGGNVVPPTGNIDGGKPGDRPSPGVIVIDGGTPNTIGYGPDINGGSVRI